MPIPYNEIAYLLDRFFDTTGPRGLFYEPVGMGIAQDPLIIPTHPAGGLVNQTRIFSQAAYNALPAPKACPSTRVDLTGHATVDALPFMRAVAVALGEGTLADLQDLARHDGLLAPAAGDAIDTALAEAHNVFVATPAADRLQAEQDLSNILNCVDDGRIPRVLINFTLDELIAHAPQVLIENFTRIADPAARIVELNAIAARIPGLGLTPAVEAAYRALLNPALLAAQREIADAAQLRFNRLDLPAIPDPAARVARINLDLAGLGVDPLDVAYRALLNPALLAAQREVAAAAQARFDRLGLPTIPDPAARIGFIEPMIAGIGALGIDPLEADVYRILLNQSLAQAQQEVLVREQQAAAALAAHQAAAALLAAQQLAAQRAAAAQQAAVVPKPIAGSTHERRLRY